MKKLSTLIVTIFLTISISSVQATAKDQNLKLKFQGNLKDSAGTLLNGTYTLKFRLYDIGSSSDPVWEETHKNVDIKEGTLKIELGGMEKLNLAFSKQYWLGVTVESDEEMSPRFRLTNNY